MDVLFTARAKLGLKEAELWELDWLEWEYQVWHYDIEMAKRQEPFRDLQAQLHNMFAEEGERKTPSEFYWLLTDRFEKQVNKQDELAAQQATWDRLQAAGLL